MGGEDTISSCVRVYSKTEGKSILVPGFVNVYRIFSIKNMGFCPFSRQKEWKNM